MSILFVVCIFRKIRSEQNLLLKGHLFLSADRLVISSLPTMLNLWSRLAIAFQYVLLR